MNRAAVTRAHRLDLLAAMVRIRQLEEAALPQVAGIVAAARRAVGQTPAGAVPR